jgi:hypothetical protein
MFVLQSYEHSSYRVSENMFNALNVVVGAHLCSLPILNTQKHHHKLVLTGKKVFILLLLESNMQEIICENIEEFSLKNLIWIILNYL